MGYFRELPNLEVLNRTKNDVSNDETVVIKNLFKRAKVREDFISVAAGFDYYSITENERPDQIAEKIYGDPELDWVVLLVNNISNVNDQWPLNVDSFNKYMIHKYGSEEAYSDIHHYETISLQDTFNREVFPGGLIVDEAFYNSPEYRSLTTQPPGITFPSIVIPGTLATATATVGTGYTISAINITNNGLGYKKVPNVYISTPPITANASAGCVVNNFAVSAIVGLNSGRGYNTTPTVSISTAPASVQATASCQLGIGLIDSTSVVSIINLQGGSGYGLTAPLVTFEAPKNILAGSYLNQSSISVGNQMEGIYVRSDGVKLYSANIFGSNQIKEYIMTTPWSVTTLAFQRELDVSADFSYCTGIEFSPDGNKMFISGGLGGSYKIIGYLLSTNWDISTATKWKQISSLSPGGIRFKPDGYTFYFLDASNPDVISQFNLTTDWDITTKGPAVATFNITTPTGDNGILGFSFFDDGKKMFATGLDNSSIFEFNLNTQWDISTAQYALTFYVGDKMINPVDVFIRPDKQQFIVAGGSQDRAFQYSILSVAKGVAQLTNGSVSSIQISQVGTGYTVPPTVTIGSPYPAVGAQALANIGVQTPIITRSYGVSNNGTGSYSFTGSASGNNPTLTVNAGDILSFNLVSVGGHPFWIKKVNSTGTLNAVTTGTITGINGAQSGILSWNTTGVTPGTYYYNCEFHAAMHGIINVLENPVGVVTSITITNSGFGYTTAPTITIDQAPISKQASAIAVVTNTGVSSIRVIEGGLNYINEIVVRLDYPEDIQNVNVNDTYSQNQKTWKWTGTEWKEKVTKEFEYLDPNTDTIIKVPGNILSRAVTNYEYENDLNEKKREIIILKPQYLSVVITDLRNAMKYDPESSTYINDKLKLTYNPKLLGV